MLSPRARVCVTLIYIVLHCRSLWFCRRYIPTHHCQFPMYVSDFFVCVTSAIKVISQRIVSKIYLGSYKSALNRRVHEIIYKKSCVVIPITASYISLFMNQLQRWHALCNQSFINKHALYLFNHGIIPMYHDNRDV